VPTIHEVTAEELAALNREFQELIAERIPRAFCRADWHFWATAMLARTGSILDSVTALAERGRRADAEVVLRTLYVHVTTFCWIAIEPDSHVDAWHKNAEAMWRVFSNESDESFGIKVLDDEIVADFASRRLKPIGQLAQDIDAFWPDHIEAFRRHPDTGKKEILTFSGLYTAIFRTASRIAHAEVDSLQANVRPRETELVVSMSEPKTFGRAAFAVPLAAFVLLIHNHFFDWPGEPRTQRLVDAMNYRPIRADKEAPIGSSTAVLGS
jgi:hypothetical protein